LHKLALYIRKYYIGFSELMSFNVITGATRAYESAIESPNIIIALILVIVGGGLLGYAGFFITNNVNLVLTNIGMNIVQWILLSLILWFFAFMFKGKKGTELEFGEIASAVGRFWVLVIVMGIVLSVGALMISSLTGLTGLILFAVLLIVGLVMIYSLYKLVKVVLQADRAKAIVVWVLLIIVFGLLSSLLNPAILSLLA